MPIPPIIQPNMKIAERLFAALEVHWREEGENQGIYRPCYYAEEEEAIAAFCAEARALGLQILRDAVGNMYFLLEGKNPNLPVVLSGSHVDSVPFGGRYDGTAGVVAAFSAIAGIKQAGVQPEHGICVMICRGEESAWFGQVSIGSKFAVGQLGAEVLQRQDAHHNNMTLANAMRGIGLKPEVLAQQKKLLPVEAIGCFVELHIEQGPKLQQEGVPLGVVSGIRGNVRFGKIICRGEAGHSGAVPHEMRKDAVRAITRLVAELEDAFFSLQQKGHDLVYTFPIIRTADAASLTTIPDYCELAIEVRSEEVNILSECQELVQEKMEEVAVRYGVKMEVASQPTQSAPALMDESFQEQLHACAKTLAAQVLTLPSGAGHDAAVFANAGIPSCMIFIRHDGLSHRHDESMDWEDYRLGVQLLTQFFCCAEMPKDIMQASFKEQLLALGAEEI